MPERSADVLSGADRLRRRGNFDDAEALYLQALENDAGSRRAHVGLQEVRRAQGLGLDLRRAYEQGPPYMRARLEPDSGKRAALYEEAVEPYRSMGLGRWERARGLDAGHSWNRVALGRRYLLEGRPGLAEAEFHAALWTEPGHPGAAYGLSVVMDQRGNHAAALLWAQRAHEAGRGYEAFGARLYRLGSRGPEGKLRDAAAAVLGNGSEQDLLYAGKLGVKKGEAYFDLARERGATDREVDAERPPVPPAALAEFIRRFGDAVRVKYRHYEATGESESFLAFLEGARALFSETTGKPLGKRGRIQSWAFIGKLIDPSASSDEPMVAECARHGVLLILGQRSGGPPEAMMARIVRREALGPVAVRGTTVEREAVWVRARYISGFLEWAGRGDVAGLALMRFVVIDEDAIARWEGDIRRVRKRLAPYRDRILAQRAILSDDPVAIEDHEGIAERLQLVSKGNLAQEVLVHENAHVVDVARHLPVGEHVLRNLGLALSRGFSSTRVVAYMERNAQLTAIAEGRAPLAALATCCATLGGSGPHALGYGEIVEGMVRAIARWPKRYPEIATDRVIVQQLHRLPPDKVRALARELMERWAVVGD